MTFSGQQTRCTHVLAGCSAFWPVNFIFLHKKNRGHVAPLSGPSVTDLYSVQLWKYFDNSAKRAAACQICYEPVEGPSQNKKGNEKAQKKVASVQVESQSDLEKIQHMFQGSPAPPSKIVPHLDITVYFFPTATYSIS